MVGYGWIWWNMVEDGWDSWIGGWVDGWMVGWMVGWLDGWLGG